MLDQQSPSFFSLHGRIKSWSSLKIELVRMKLQGPWLNICRLSGSVCLCNAYTFFLGGGSPLCCYFAGHPFVWCYCSYVHYLQMKLTCVFSSSLADLALLYLPINTLHADQIRNCFLCLSGAWSIIRNWSLWYPVSSLCKEETLA